ncbi:MAG: hypothetical protein J6M35_05360 [Clostridia bacterium]|nr:hypothetical protein [Clostridia bacterium]
MVICLCNNVNVGNTRVCEVGESKSIRRYLHANGTDASVLVVVSWGIY